ncbi:MAG: aminoglycoside phosphotransferase [Betaproteobacteria bacterium RIFCSPLOWO2_02_FULL_65_24]|nr:MAG: aminoglycoside phosphotransferase [Betaproteobacteria bacterium RIFCSPLOWO2_02_FULL_65_24]OGA78364.1 MAG: aminoglycoside phosphotransferase [Betaproteobacteria bacterium RIFCSPLOWO2_12_FULL_66_14]
MSDQFVGTMPVQERHRFDAAVLETYLRGRIEGFSGPLAIEQFKGGQSNPTYRLSAGGRHYVLRAKPGPAAKLLPSAHAVDREFRVITALGHARIPVPRTYCLCEDEGVIGRSFFVMECVEGRVFWDQSLPGIAPAERAAIYDEMNRVIAALHKVDFAAIGLADYGKPGNYFARQIGRWSKQYQASETETIEAMDDLIAWLPANIPAGEETSVVHGDYRLDNLIFHPAEPRILAILDWELSTLGHPLADFSYHCISWHIPPGHFRGIAGLDHASLGIPSEAQYIGAYCKRTGRDGIGHWDFYLAYNLFRLAAILQGIMKRALEGIASSRQALDAGRRTRPLAELGWQYAQKAMQQI